MSNRSIALPSLFNRPLEENFISLDWAPLRRGVRGIMLSMLMLLAMAAYASDQVDSTGTEPSGGGCIQIASTGEITGFCGPRGSFDAQCTAFWQSVTGDSSVFGYGGGYGSLCFGSGGGSGRVTTSIGYLQPTCPGDALLTGSTCTCRPGTGADPTHKQCWPVVDVTLPHDCPLCELLRGNPIVPLRGVKKEFVDTGLRVGHLPLTLTYDSTGRAPGVQRETATAVLRPGLGELWFSSLHRRLVPQADTNVVVQRGDGRALAFQAQGGGSFAGVAGRADRLTAQQTAGQTTWQYINAQDNSRELYDASGQLASITWSDGARVNFTYSTESWATVNGEGQTVLLSGTNRVRFGNWQWIEKTVTGNFECAKWVFGYDPDTQHYKVCQVATVTPADAPAGGYLLSAQDERGRSLAFRYDSQGRIARIEDAAGQAIVFAYDTLGNLETVGWPDGQVRRFVYENAALPWALTGVVDEAAARHASFGYDADGRAVSTELAGGVNRYVASYVSAPQATVTEAYDIPHQLIIRTHAWSAPQGTVVVNPNGSSAGLAATSVNGRTYLSGQSQAAGAGCTASTSGQALDANGNPLSRDDFNGTRSCYVHDPSRFLQTGLVEGLAQSADCAAVTAAGAALPAGARRTTTQWHPDWSFTIKVAAPGQITTSIYNGQPDPFNGNAIASCAPSSAVLPDGKPIAVLCKQVEQSTTDADGHLGFSAGLQAGVANRVSTWTYDARGQVLSSTGPRTAVNDTTTSVYYVDTTADHTSGDRYTVTNAAGEVTTFNRYDKYGNVLQSTDANGNVTLNTYDARQRLLTRSLGGETTTYTYDAVGQLTKATQVDGSWVGYEYDDAHRQVAVKDHLGNRIDYQLDNTSNKTGQSVKDPSGNLRRSMAQVLDALGRTQQTSGSE
jgi:YD repeat-containing protein